jgi:hypothetical protein
MLVLLIIKPLTQKMIQGMTRRVAKDNHPDVANQTESGAR